MKQQLIKLFEWSKDGNLERIKNYFENKYKSFGELNHTPKEIMVKDTYGRNLLHWVCFYGQIGILRFLVENFLLDLEVPDNQGCTPLDCAAMRGQLNRVQKISYQVSFSKKNQFIIILRLIKSGALLSRKYKNVNNPLHWAFYYGNRQLIKCLCEMDFTLNLQQNDEGMYPIDYLFLTEKPQPYLEEINDIFLFLIKKFQLYQQEKLEIKEENSDGEEIISIVQNKFYLKQQKWGAAIEPSVSQPNKTKIIQCANFQIPRINFSYLTRDKNDKQELDNKISISSAPNSQLRLNNKLGFTNNKLRLKKPSFIKTQEKRRKKYDMQLVILKHLLLDSDDFEQRLMYWSAYLNFHEKTLQYLKKGFSPFTRVYKGMSTLHIVAEMGHESILRIFVERKYSYQGRILDTKQLLNSVTGRQTSTAIHIAIERNHYKCARILLEAGASISIYNYRSLKPLEIKYNKSVTDLKKDYIQRPLTVIEKGFQYVIKTRSQKQISNDIVRNQLINIHLKLKEQGIDFEFLSFQSYEKHKQNQQPLYFYHVIRLGPDAVYKLAKIYETRMYNMEKKTTCLFKYKKRTVFEFPKAQVLQDLILRALENEFNMDVFMMEGLVLDHFPLEDHIITDEMSLQWGWRDILKLLFNCLQIESDEVAIRGLCGISFYYGPVVGWYFAFMAHLISWLFIPSVIGIIFGLYILIQEFNSQLIPLYAIIMALWSTLFIESWKRRENELKFLWDMYDFQKIEQRRAKYSGPFRVDEYGVREFDPFITFKRRLLVEAPIILLGLIFVLASWYSFRILGNMVKDNNILSFGVGILNGLVMPILSGIYSLICQKVVNWENHIHKSDEQYSYILKVFFFEFVNSYVPLIDKAISKSDPKMLAISVASIVITRGIIQNQTNIIPFILNKLKNKEYQENELILSERQRNYEDYSFKLTNQNQPTQQDDNQHIVLKTKKNQNKIQRIFDQEYIIEHKLDINEQNFVINQVEISANKEPQKILINEYTDLAIQFGYITMFATAFPGAPIFFMLNLIFNLKFSLYNYKNVMRRETAKASPGLGIWLQIFILMNYSATVMNCILIGTVNGNLLNNLIEGETSKKIMILVAMEHLITLIKFIIATIIADIPDWIKKELKRQEYVLSYE